MIPPSLLASRLPLCLLQAIQAARTSCAIVLTTHYMEEAEGLCDRLGVFVGGQLRCLGSPKVGAVAQGAYNLPLSFSLTLSLSHTHTLSLTFTFARRT
jgi:ABC-type multidrug transport system ATPase subunit